MIIRLGYVAIAMNLEKVTSSSPVTYKHYSSLQSDKAFDKLKAVTLSNINDLEKIIDYNIENDIHFYRMTSKLVPLATHPDVDYEYRNIFKKEFLYINYKEKFRE